jgi:hypothetical protein
MKKLNYVNSRVRAKVIPPPPHEEPVLDVDFDDCDETILFEPPLLATRRAGGRLTRLTDDTTDDE